MRVLLIVYEIKRIYGSLAGQFYDNFKIITSFGSVLALTVINLYKCTIVIMYSCKCVEGSNL